MSDEIYPGNPNASHEQKPQTVSGANDANATVSPVSEQTAGNQAQNSRRHRRHRGAPPGNQNARKHGFYSKAIPPELRQKLYDAGNVKGLDEEIAWLRAKLAIAGENCVDYRQLVPGFTLLDKLINTRKKLGFDTDDGLKNAFARAWAEILPPGISDPIQAYCILSDYLKSGAPLPPSHHGAKRVENAHSNENNNSIEVEQHDLQKTNQAQANGL